MKWGPVQVEFEALSPICVGLRPIGFVRKCRHYIPGRNLWGAISASLTRILWEDPLLAGKSVSERYAFVGNKILGKAFRPGYLYVKEGPKILAPSYRIGEGLRYGDLDVRDFERRYLGAVGLTSLNPSAQTAEEQSLHELEYLSRVPKRELTAPTSLGPVHYAGIFFVGEEGEYGETLDFFQDASPLRRAIEMLTVGGGQRVGFGRLGFVTAHRLERNALRGWALRDERRLLLAPISEGQAAWAHLIVESTLENRKVTSFAITGGLERLSGRSYHRRKGAGQELAAAPLAAMPGSVPRQVLAGQLEFQVEVDKFGIWTFPEDAADEDASNDSKRSRCRR